jgi:hypothetical protein
MELKRVMGRLAPRWPVLIIAGLIGAIAAFIFVGQRNSEVESRSTTAGALPMRSRASSTRHSNLQKP